MEIFTSFQAMILFATSDWENGNRYCDMGYSVVVVDLC
jgi:hypothetical protein